MKKQLSVNQFDSKYKLDIRKAMSMDIADIFLRPGYDIDYDIKLENGKNLQRDFVWTIEQKRSVIVSILKKIEIPNCSFVLYRERPGINTTLIKVVDGKQRLKAIEEFVKGKFGIIVDNEEYFFSDLDPEANYRLITHSLNVNVIYEYDDKKLSDDQLISWFELVNFAGTPQDLDHLEKLKS